MRGIRAGQAGIYRREGRRSRNWTFYPFFSARTRNTRFSVLTAAGTMCLFILCFIAMPVAAMNGTSGLVVSFLEEDGAGSRAGLKAGDILVSWQAHNEGHDHGDFSSAWQFIDLEQEYALGVSVDLIGIRDGKDRVFSLSAPKEWGITVHPLLVPKERERLSQALEFINTCAYEEGIGMLRELAYARGGTDEDFSYFLYLASAELEKAGALDQSIAVLNEALKTTREHYYTGQIHYRLAKEYMLKGLIPDAKIQAERAVALVSVYGTRRELGFVKKLVLSGYTRLKLMQLDQVDDLYRQAFEICTEIAPESLTMASIQNGLGAAALRRGKLDVAQKYIEQAGHLFEVLEPLHPSAGSVAHNLGVIHMTRGNLDEADLSFKKALSVRQANDPDSVVVGDTLIGLGVVALRRGFTDDAAKYARQAVTIHHQFAPGGQSESYGLELLGGAAWDKCDFARAESCFNQVLEMREKLSSGSNLNATTLVNLGAVAIQRGDFAKGEKYLRHALVIQNKNMPGSLEVALILHNLGTTMWSRDDYNGAESYLRQAMVIREKQAPGSVYVAETYSNLGGLYRDLGRQADAEEYMMKALKCWRAVGPNDLNVALLLGNLANWKAEDGDLERAGELAAQSLHIRETVAPGSSAHAMALQGMGILAEEKGQLERAENYFRQSLKMFENNGVANHVRVSTWYHLGNALRKDCRLEDAADAYYRAIEDLENLVGRLGGSEDSHTNFRATHHKIYQSLIDLLVEMNQGAKAFDMLERSRARGFLNMLGERDLMFTADIPEELDRQRRMVRAELEKNTVKLSELSESDTDQRKELQQALQSNHVRLSEIREQIRAKAPRLASLTAPEPLNYQQSLSALDDGTLALSYSVGKKNTQLFILGPGEDDFRVVTLSVGDKMLRRKIRRLRNVLTDPLSGLGILRHISGSLSHVLLSPANDEILRANRILFVPDGPLHQLPFGVLSVPGGDEYLVLSKPIHRASSLTVFAQLKAERRKRATWRIAGLGAPVYPELDRKDSKNLLTAYTRGRPLGPLPWSRNEVSGLMTLFPETAHVWLGGEATEERARSIGKSADIVHFACHALVDENHPLESALILTIPEKPGEEAQNGLLQAWEIIESMRLDAGLVVLSACRTALGREMAGEGIVGLTRAFQFAGAHAVVASLWPVADRSTAVLMERFYEYLAKGLSVDEALRSAQIELASKPVQINSNETDDFSHPYFWAAFQLSGDWK